MSTTQFTSLRSQLQNWTLDNDQRLFNSLKTFSETMFTEAKRLQSEIRNTKFAMNNCNSDIDSGFNGFFKLSETKFTQNKMASVEINQIQQKSKTIRKEERAKIDLQKEAITVGIFNIEDEDNDGGTIKDNASVSDFSTNSLISQTVFKNAKLPSFFFTKDFRHSKYLGLIDPSEIKQFDQIPNPSEIQSSRQIDPIPSSDRNITVAEATSGLLPPPPPIVPPSSTSAFESFPLPVPPPFNLPPPPPLPPPVFNPSNNAALPPIPALPKIFTNEPQPSSIRLEQPIQQPVIEKPPQSSGTIDLAELMRTRKKMSKNRSNESQEQEPSNKVNNPKYQQSSKLQEPRRQSVVQVIPQPILPQPVLNVIPHAIRQSIKQTLNPYQQPALPNIGIIDDDEVQDDDIFKSKAPKKNKNVSKITKPKDTEINDSIMNKKAFDENIVIKTKEQVSQPIIIEKRTTVVENIASQKIAEKEKKSTKNKLFGDDEEEEEKQIKPRKTKPQKGKQKEKQTQKQKDKQQKSLLLSTQLDIPVASSITSPLKTSQTLKKQSKVQPKKVESKKKNLLFGDQEESQEEDFNLKSKKPRVTGILLPGAGIGVTKPSEAKQKEKQFEQERKNKQKEDRQQKQRKEEKLKRQQEQREKQQQIKKQKELEQERKRQIEQKRLREQQKERLRQREQRERKQKEQKIQEQRKRKEIMQRQEEQEMKEELKRKQEQFEQANKRQQQQVQKKRLQVQRQQNRRKEEEIKKRLEEELEEKKILQKQEMQKQLEQKLREDLRKREIEDKMKAEKQAERERIQKQKKKQQDIKTQRQAKKQLEAETSKQDVLQVDDIKITARKKKPKKQQLFSEVDFDQPSQPSSIHVNKITEIVPSTQQPIQNQRIEEKERKLSTLDKIKSMGVGLGPLALPVLGLPKKPSVIAQNEKKQMKLQAESKQKQPQQNQMIKQQRKKTNIKIAQKVQKPQTPPVEQYYFDQEAKKQETKLPALSQLIHDQSDKIEVKSSKIKTVSQIVPSEPLAILTQQEDHKKSNIQKIKRMGGQGMGGFPLGGFPLPFAGQGKIKPGEVKEKQKQFIQQKAKEEKEAAERIKQHSIEEQRQKIQQQKIKQQKEAEEKQAAQELRRKREEKQQRQKRERQEIERQEETQMQQEKEAQRLRLIKQQQQKRVKQQKKSQLEKLEKQKKLVQERKEQERKRMQEQLLQQSQQQFMPKKPSKNPLGGVLSSKPAPGLLNLPKFDESSSPKKLPLKKEQPQLKRQEAPIKKKKLVDDEEPIQEQSQAIVNQSRVPAVSSKKPGQSLLFGDSDEEESKPKQKPNVSKHVKKGSKGKLLLDNDDDEELFNKKSIKKQEAKLIEQLPKVAPKLVPIKQQQEEATKVIESKSKVPLKKDKVGLFGDSGSEQQIKITKKPASKIQKVEQRPPQPAPVAKKNTNKKLLFDDSD